MRLFVFVLAAMVLSWTGCSSSTSRGVEVTIALEAPSSPDLEGASRRFATDLGLSVELSRGYLATGAVEIFRCEGSIARVKPRPWLLREAFAHSVGSPTRLGIPAVESLLAPVGAREVIGEIYPAEATYCSARQTLHPADDDALGLPEDVSMVGRSLFMEGTYARGEAAPSPFRIVSDAELERDVTLPAIALDAKGRRTARLVLTKAADRWFDGVDFERDDEGAIARRVLENVRDSLGAHIE